MIIGLPCISLERTPYHAGGIQKSRGGPTVGDRDKAADPLHLAWRPHGHAHEPIMLTAARALSALSVFFTVVAIDAWRVHLVPWGFEATGYVAGLSVLLATVFAVAVLAIVAIAARSGRRAQFMPALLLCALCLLTLIVLVGDLVLRAALGLDDRFGAARLAAVSVPGASTRPAAGAAPLEN
jgi:hypothetical protein